MSVACNTLQGQNVYIYIYIYLRFTNDYKRNLLPSSGNFSKSFNKWQYSYFLLEYGYGSVSKTNLSKSVYEHREPYYKMHNYVLCKQTYDI